MINLRKTQSGIIAILLSILFLNSAIAQSAEADSTEIGKVTINRSGFLSKDTTIILYRKYDHKILQVVENGKEVAEDKLYKYENELENALDNDVLVQKLPEIDELEKRLDSPDFPDSAKLAEIKRILENMDDMKSEIGSIKVNMLKIRREILIARVLRNEIRNLLESNNFNPGDNVKTLELSRGKCKIDGVELGYDLAWEVRKIVNKYRFKKLGEDESIQYEFDD